MSFNQGSASNIVVLYPSTVTATATAGTTGSAYNIPFINSGLLLVLDITAAAAAVGDTLDVQVQTLVGGTEASGTWQNICWFTQALGNGGVKRFYVKLTCASAVATFASSTALTAGTQKDLFGDRYRINYALVDGGAHGQSFTFSVVAIPF